MFLPPHLPGARWFVFLVRDDGPRPKDPKALEAMQAAHIGNFERRHAEGRLVAAGPVEDPTRHRRGIVVLSVGSRKEVLACFGTDPFVRGRIMRVEAHRWAVPAKGFVDGEKGKMAEYRVVRVALPREMPFPNLLGGVGGGFAGERMGVILTASTDDAAIRRALDASPAVRAGATYDVIPLYMQAGTL